MPSWRTLLILGRTSNLPTVWSNCLAGWWLGGADNPRALPPLLAGATLMYTGGVFLNDAFDQEFDSQFRRERPLPSGAITPGAVWLTGSVLIGAGVICLSFLGAATGLFAVVLALGILLYDAVHKLITASPLLMAGCRFLLYLVAASTGADGLNGEAVWCGLALAGYVAGLSYLAQKETSRNPVAWWPCLLLAAPLAMAFIMDATRFYLNPALLIMFVLLLWSARSLRYAFAFAGTERNVGRSVAGLIAGIAWVDLLAVAYSPRLFAGLFILLFLAAFFLQQVVPAT
jgi:heme O synthase-like polyprenyltransferase